MTYLFRKGGIPALALPLLDHVPFTTLSPSPSPLPCNLIVVVDQSSQQAQVELQFDLDLQGFGSHQRVSLLYDADNFEPGTPSVHDATAASKHREYISRRGQGQGKLKALRLGLREPCVVVPPALDLRAKTDSRTPFEHLAALSRATMLDIVFDYGWLHPTKQAHLEYLVRTSGLSGISRNGLRADWTVFSPSEAPPVYADVSLKRPHPSSPRSPKAKRLLHDDCIPHPLEDLDLGSPTEKATTICSSSPFAAPSNDAAAAAEAALAKLLPHAMRDILPEILADVLPGILRETFTVAASTPPPHATPPPNPLSPLQRLISARMQVAVDQIECENFDHAIEVRNTAELVTEECIEDHRVELAELRENNIAEIERLFDTKFREMHDLANELVETAELEGAEVYTSVKQQLDAYMVKQLKLMKVKLGTATWEKLESAAAKRVAQRASSVPAEVGW